VQLSPYLNFDGQCEEAFKFYERCLRAKLASSFRYEGTPAAGQVPAGWGNKIMHACLVMGDQELMGADCPPDRYQKPQGFSVTIALQDAAEAERIFHELAENGTVQMPIQETFWATRFGMLVDQFGIPWMINCGKSA